MTAIVLLALTLVGWLKVWLLVPIAFLGFIGQGLVRPNATQGALEPMAAIAGVASAVMTGIQTLTGAGSSALVAALFDGRSALAMTAMMAICAIGSTLVYLFVVRPAERHLRHPAVASDSSSSDAQVPQEHQTVISRVRRA